MQMSKCLCLMIIAVIVIATNASQFRERRNGGSGSNWGNNVDNWGNSQDNEQPAVYYLSPTTYTENNQQYQSTTTKNTCQSGQTICCNNDANSDSTTNSRRKRHSNLNNGNAFKVTHSKTNQQHTCYNQATNGASGNQYNGCESNQSCCQGNNSTGSAVTISCSSVSLPSN
ncbi:unnamed protein product [Adineta steineri]|uniref:Uncharacterized protein n=1 Tax=Adineta steineri TaxID=433720 RepID=A0A814G0Z7_9BILA|nr:unnamed protein product [Adineta steineri]CAF0989715.1 unnamed protein product [Adineta steineri]